MIYEFEKRKLDLAGTLQTPIKTNKRKDSMYRKIYEFVNKEMIRKQKSRTPFMQVCMIVRKDVFKKLGGFDETLIFGEDSELAKRAVRIFSFGIIEEKVLISPRRFEKEGFGKVLIKGIYFNLGRILGFEFRKGIIKYDKEF